MITQEALKSALTYDPETGIFRWAIDKGQRVKAGCVAGHLASNGYVVIRINQQTYKAHRLAWLYMHGEWPEPFIDHINRDPSDNRLKNLRCASRSENNFNRAYPNKNGAKGISVRRTSSGRLRYIAQISYSNQRTGRCEQKYLGRFDSAEEASEFYQLAVEITGVKAVYG